jgi:hypothetical protein
MTNDKILMNLIEAVQLALDNKKNANEKKAANTKAEKILSETMAFLKHRNPDKNRENDAFSRTETKI